MLKTTKDAKTEADKALDDADIKSLYRLFNEKCKQVEALAGGLGAMVDTGKTSPRESDNTISAMRDIALAAIELAKDVATKK